MKKLTIASTVLAASMCLGTQSAMAAGSLDDQDMQFAFGAENNEHTMMLSEQEMMETEGAYGWWGAAAGFATASYGYIGASYGSGNFNWNTYGQVATAGAIAGLVTPTPTAVNFGRNIGTAFGSGYAAGSIWSWF